jgi:hypothetical protein
LSEDMEDAHDVRLQLKDKARMAMFGVYDGHSGMPSERLHRFFCLLCVHLLCVPSSFSFSAFLCWSDVQDRWPRSGPPRTCTASSRCSRTSRRRPSQYAGGVGGGMTGVLYSVVTFSF